MSTVRATEKRTLWLWGTMALAVLVGLAWYQVPLVSSQGIVVRAHFQEGDVPTHPEDPARSREIHARRNRYFSHKYFLNIYF